MDTQLCSPPFQHDNNYSESSRYETPPDHEFLQDLDQNQAFLQDSEKNYPNRQRFENPQKIEIEEEGRQDQNFEDAQDSKPLLENDKWEHYSSDSEPNKSERIEEPKQVKPQISALETGSQQKIEEADVKEVQLILQEISALIFAIYHHLDGTKGQEDALKEIISMADQIRGYVQNKFSEVKSPYQNQAAGEAKIVIEEICALIFNIYFHLCETKGLIEALHEVRYIRECFQTRQQKICSQFSNQDKEKVSETVESPKPIPEKTIQKSENKELSYDPGYDSIETKDKLYEKRENHFSNSPKISKLKVESQSNFEQKPLPRNSNYGLRNLGKTCFMNALFRCLFDVVPFREKIIEIKDHKTYPLIKNFSDLFCKMKTRKDFKDSSRIDREHEKLVDAIYNTRKEFQRNQEGDSSILFRAIVDEFTHSKDLQTLPQSQMFAGSLLTKEVWCQNCDNVKVNRESMHIISVFDQNFLQENQKSFFQPLYAKRPCSCSHEKTDWTCFYKATSLPQVIAVRINDTINSNFHVKVLPKVILPQLNLTVRSIEGIQYNLVSAVLNSSKGKHGSHSVALSYQNGSYFIHDDDKPIRGVQFKDIQGHPQLLFYVKS